MQKVIESDVEVQKTKKPVQWSSIMIGAVVNISGVKCRLVNVHPGKRRLTFTPVDERVRVPDSVRDPKWYRVPK